MILMRLHQHTISDDDTTRNLEAICSSHLSTRIGAAKQPVEPVSLREYRKVVAIHAVDG